MEKQDIKSMTQEELRAFLVSLGEKPFRTVQIYQWMHEKLASSFDDMTNLSKVLRQKLQDACEYVSLEKVRVQISQIDGTRKYLFRLADGNVIESVLMRYKHGNSVCISSQVGCRMGCRFCASTLDGLERNLRPSEMLDQIYQIQRDTGERVSNVVVMGSGEPLDNYDNLIRFIHLLTEEGGLHISQRNVTVSTCGLVPKIRELADQGLTITLALSLHAPNDEVRKSLMPIARTYALKDVLAACHYYFEKTGRRMTFEYSLVQGVNDNLDEARELLAGGKSRLVRYTMGGENSDTGMICGGAICLCYLHLDVLQVPLFQSVADVLAYRRIGDFVIDFEPFVIQALEGDVVEYHGETSRHTIAGCPELSLVEEGSKVTYTNAASEIPPAHIETLCPEGLTYIFGCGHVGAATARVLTAAGFAVVACDDRPGTLTPEWVPGVYDRRLVDYKNLGEQCPIGPRDLVVVATAGHKSDIDVVIQAMRAKPAYLGCLGSRRKTAFVRARLEQEGFTQDQIDGLHLPIGVAIEAEDPEEIAISIAAEMIHLRRTKLVPRKR